MLYYTSILGTRPASAAASASAAAAGRRGLRREHYDASHVCQVMSDCSFRHVPSVLISLLHSGGPRSDFGRQLLGAGPEWRASSSDRRIHASIHLSLLMYVYIYIYTHLFIYTSIQSIHLYAYTSTHLYIGRAGGVEGPVRLGHGQRRGLPSQSTSPVADRRMLV